MKILRCLFVMLLCFPLAVLAAAKPSTGFVAGKDYKVLKVTPPVGVTVSDNSVIEFFNPGCPACFHTEPMVESWLKRKPKAVAFSRMPLAYFDEWKLYSKIYFVAVKMKNENKVLPALFDTLQVKKTPITTPDAAAQLFVKADPSLKGKESKIKTDLNSLSININMSQAQQMMTTYQVMQIPAFLVNGKYLVNGQMAGSPERMVEIVEYLTTLK